MTEYRHDPETNYRVNDLINKVIDVIMHSGNTDQEGELAMGVLAGVMLLHLDAHSEMPNMTKLNIRAGMFSTLTDGNVIGNQDRFDAHLERLKTLLDPLSDEEVELVERIKRTFARLSEDMAKEKANA